MKPITHRRSQLSRNAVSQSCNQSMCAMTVDLYAGRSVTEVDYIRLDSPYPWSAFVSNGWIEAAFELEGHRIAVSVKRLPQDEVSRLAASLAWFANVAVTPGANLDTTEWPQLLQRIMAEYVALTVADDALDRLDELWTPLCSGVLRTFAQVNEIDPVVMQQLMVRTGRVC